MKKENGGEDAKQEFSALYKHFTIWNIHDCENKWDTGDLQHTMQSRNKACNLNFNNFNNIFGLKKRQTI